MPFALPVPPHWSTRGPLRRTLLDPEQEYLAFACQLLSLIKDGQGDSDEALHLRARMDGPWSRHVHIFRTPDSGGGGGSLLLLRPSPPKRTKP